MLNRKRWISVLVIILLLIGGVFWKQIGEKIMGEDNRKENGLKDKSTVQKTKDASGDKLATREFLIKTFHVTEEDIKKYEVEEVVSALGLTEDFFMHEKENFSEPSDVVSVFARLQEDFHEPVPEGKFDFSNLYKAKEFKGEFPDVNTIKYLAASNYIGDGGSSFVIDFKDNKIYYLYNTAFVYEDIRRADKVVELTEKERNEVLTALEKAEIDKWNYSYINEKEPSGEVFWDFGMEFDNGSILSFKGKGDTADSYPELREVIFGLSKQ